MKNTLKYILTGLFLLAATQLMQAQNDGTTYNTAGGVSTAKNVTGPNEDGSYTISLETFATGTSALITTSTPVDVILVLDTSSSMTESYNGTTRIAALKSATQAFVSEIARNDREDDDGNAREKVLGNRIQIVTFNTNVTNLFSDFQPASANETTINTQVGNIGTSKGTRTDLGMTEANVWANTSKSSTYWTTNNLKEDNDHNIVIVLFTDGCPSTSGSNDFTASYAITAVNQAYTAKNTHGATVYTVGLIVWSNLSTANQTRVRNMMDYMSSNFPDGQASSTNTFTCTGTRASSDYYQDATEVDLEDIFTSIAQASGGSSATIGSQTQVRDVVSSSFTIPEGATADDIDISIWKITRDGTSWTEDTAYDMSAISPVIGTNDDGNSTLVVEGFDYSLDDTTQGAGDGNWVGIRYDSNNNRYYAGRKVVITFNIAVSDNATGGVGSATNTSDSGVYVYDEETQTYTCVNHYDVPHTTLSVTLRISKTGLRHGESATFEVQRTRPLGWDESKTKEVNIANMQYNALGKPLPDEDNWETFSKVIVTNKGADGATVTKALVGLDPYWVYKLLEDDWGWAYTITGEGTTMTTSEVEENPFNFRNVEKTDVPKHAEAVTINHFATSASGESHTEEYSSSKVTSF